MRESGVSQPRAGQYEVRLGDELRGERATLGKSLLDIQRDLKIRAAYLEAIETCDASVFPDPSFVAGYVRSYARYLRLDPDEVYARFCAESGHGGGRGPARPEARAGLRPAKAAVPGAAFRSDFPLAGGRRRRLPDIPFGAIGSLLVLVALIGALGWGGWTVLQNIQRVEFAPVEEVPIALAELEPPAAPEAAAEPVLPDLATPVAATALADLYRRQELEVPILVPRDGPIANIDPDRTGLLARAERQPAPAPIPASSSVDERMAAEAAAEAVADTAEPAADSAEPQVTEPDTRPTLSVVAERPAWIRIYFANGTVIFERIPESGEVYEVPETAETPMIWAGNSGSVYVRIDKALHGPIGIGTRASRDVPLDPAALADRFEVVADVPSVIAETMPADPAPAGTLVQ